MFQNLRYVVIDELHTYRGVFGSHVANVLAPAACASRASTARTRCSSAPPPPSATRASTPRACSGVDEDELALIDESGAPQGERRVFLYNPPVVNAELGIRASYVKRRCMLAADLVRARVPTIVFGQSRNNVEVMLRYLRDKVAPRGRCRRRDHGLPRRLPPRARGARSSGSCATGEILCVVATNALELGIDIGELDAVVCAGYPGSVAAHWQRFGRAGRRGGRSICVLVTSSAPLDQYLAREPAYLLGAPVEEARIDPDNPEILVQHLKCAAFELPFERGEPFGDAATPDEHARARSVPRAAQGRGPRDERARFHWAADAYPANNVSLRSIGWDNFVIIDAEHDKTLAEIDWRGAHTMLHEQAIYQHDGEQYQVERFDYENHKAFVRKVEPDYFTDAMTYTTRERPRGVRRRPPQRSAGATRARGLGRGLASSRRSSATRRSSSTRTRTRATATCGCPRCRCTRPRSG